MNECEGGKEWKREGDAVVVLSDRHSAEGSTVRGERC